MTFPYRDDNQFVLYLNPNTYACHSNHPCTLGDGECVGGGGGGKRQRFPLTTHCQASHTLHKQDGPTDLPTRSRRHVEYICYQAWETFAISKEKDYEKS